MLFLFLWLSLKGCGNLCYLKQHVIAFFRRNMLNFASKFTGFSHFRVYWLIRSIKRVLQFFNLKFYMFVSIWVFSHTIMQIEFHPVTIFLLESSKSWLRYKSWKLVQFAWSLYMKILVLNTQWSEASIFCHLSCIHYFKSRAISKCSCNNIWALCFNTFVYLLFRLLVFIF